MNITRFILILLTVYLSLLTTIFAVFGVEKYFISELIIFALFVIFGLVVVVKQYSGQKKANAFSAIFFSIVLLNLLFLFFMHAADPLQSQTLYVMLISALLGLLFSFTRPCRRCKSRKGHRSNPKKLRVRQMADEIPQVLSEVYDIIEDTKKYEGSDKKSSTEDILEDTMVYEDEESDGGIHEDESSEWETFELEKAVDGVKKPEVPMPKVLKRSTAKSGKTVNPGKFVASSISKRYHRADCDWAKKIVDKNAVWFRSKAEADKKKYKPCNCVNK